MINSNSYSLFLATLSFLAISSCSTTPNNVAGQFSEESAIQPNGKALNNHDLCSPPTDYAQDLGSIPQLDLWERIRHGYSLSFTYNPRIQKELSWFSKHPEYIQRVSERAGSYLYHVVNELEARNMPTELALLPIVESAFDPFAYSPGRASGMWQIIPGTGKMLGLKQTWWYDGRRDIIASTDAALTFLQQLNKRFNGDWYLTLAAYNSGPGTVNKAIRKNKAKGKALDYWSLPLPRETKSYVPRLLALSEIFLDPERHNVKLAEVKDAPFFVEVDVKSQIDLAHAALLAGLPMEEFYKLNPGFNRWATDPEGPHRLLVPIEKAAHFQEQLNNLPEDQRITWQRHTIKNGETLSHIAKKYKISTASLQSINKIRGTNIRAGKTLLVPTATKGYSHYSFSADQRLAKKQDSGAKAGKHKVKHKVQKGDSFWAIAKQYDVKSSHVAKWNNMAPRDTLSVGQTLVVWVDQLPTVSADQVIRKLSYKVRNGDSLHKIANKFRVKVQDIVRWNQISTKKYLQPGQAIVLFVDVKS